jgi:flavin reductase (DIM6/NTAB) family NADH-FMN oxidoreductase RutF
LECVSQATIVTGPHQVVVIGRVLGAHVDDAFVEDAERGYVKTAEMGLVARMHGSGWYARSTDLFQLARPTVAD